MPNINSNNKLFGLIAIKMGWLDINTVKEILKQQAIDVETGLKKHIGVYCWEAGKLTKEQIKIILEHQKKFLHSSNINHSIPNNIENENNYNKSSTDATFDENENLIIDEPVHSGYSSTPKNHQFNFKTNIANTDYNGMATSMNEYCINNSEIIYAGATSRVIAYFIDQLIVWVISIRVQNKILNK